MPPINEITIPIDLATLPINKKTFPIDHATPPIDEKTISIDQAMLPIDEKMFQTIITMRATYEKTKHLLKFQKMAANSR